MTLLKSLLSKKYFEILVVFIVFIVSIFFYHSSPSQYLSDDSIFYLIIAQYINESSISSFNGYIQTNGYHPLWMIFNILSVDISKLFEIDALMVIGIIYQLFLAGSIYFIFKIGNILKVYSAPIASVILIFLFISNGALHNMESALALFFVVYTIYYIIINDQASSKQYFSFGILLGLVILSRLDLIFFGLIVSIYILIKYRAIFVSSPKELVYFILGGLIIVLPYFIYNQLTFGGITPVSGALKSSFPNIEFALKNIFPYGLISSFFALVALIIAFKIKSKDVRFIFITLAISTIVHSIYLAMFQDAMTWYYITGFLIISLVIAFILYQVDNKYVSNIFLLFIMIVAISTSYIKSVSDYTLSTHILHHKRLNFNNESQMKNFAEILREKLPRNATLFTWDVPGFIAYYGKFRVFSADGLITNKNYQKELVEDGASKIFYKYNIKYILVPITNKKVMYYDGMEFQPLQNGNYLVTIYSRLYHIKVGEFKLSKKDIEFTLLSPYAGTDSSSPVIGVFKIPK